MQTYDKIPKVATGQRDDCTIGCLPYHVYFKNCHEMIAIDLDKQQVLHTNPKEIQQINFARNLDRVGNATMFFIIEEAKNKNILNIS